MTLSVEQTWDILESHGWKGERSVTATMDVDAMERLATLLAQSEDRSFEHLVCTLGAAVNVHRRIGQEEGFEEAAAHMAPAQRRSRL